VVRNTQPLLVPDTRTDERWNPLVDEMTAFSTRSVLGVPLLARDQTVGVLEALNKRGGTFTQEDVTTLQWLAAQAAVAIVNARLFHQSDLIAEMVHELRTPLTALMAAEQLLLRPELSEAQRRELVGTLQRETGRLAQLTTDFLDMARLESGRASFSPSEFDLPTLLRESVEIVQPHAIERQIALDIRLGGQMPALVTDRDKLKQVLLNLLTNAIKYNQHGGRVTLRVEFVPQQFQVYVDDTGPGIPPAAIAHLFDKFYRAPNVEGVADGTGLGLTIAKRIVEALGGEIGVQSTLGQGSTFYFYLPPVPRKTNPLTE
jgi:signal transduction histidine kinase